MRLLSAFLAGGLFGSGLLLAGMANPAKVLAFLDLSGAWDPSLALVMLAAVASAALPMRWPGRHERSLLGVQIQLPGTRQLDRRLILGSIAFGVGWGLFGLCPGPALLLLPSLQWPVWAFSASMLVGMGIFSVLEGRYAMARRDAT